jgi:tetratricopeptide (TPR) repeat protein
MLAVRGRAGGAEGAAGHTNVRSRLDLMTGSASEQLADDAQASFDAGEFQRARDAALAVLAEHPRDGALLRVAGRAAMELGLDDAVARLEQAAAVDENDPDGWRYLGEALAYEGRNAEAAKAFERALALRPGDDAALVGLGHVAFAVGRGDESIAHLRRAVEHDPANAGALRALVEALRREGRLEEALETATALAASRPDDVLAALDVGELSLDLGRPDAAAAFARLREIDDDPEHQVFAYHGMIEAELRREEWRRALDAAVEATRVDRLGRTTDILAYVVARVFGESGREAPDSDMVARALAASRAEHRHLHLEALVL